ncbi:RagB/SusD family nutrient uptake outer membrane protein [Mucilaginibacter gynuensis]|uniref:RagB/SusD family nutrient uptake outer membrane protein n=1 Tax=Mucilaginibacter gynuensis TaxID=1302236 RepID=A0ABP8FPJ8_9SPHI
MRLRYLNKTTIIILVTAALFGCKKLDVSRKDVYTDDNFWQVNANAFNALSTCYSQQISGGYGGSSSASQAYFYNEALSDNAFCPLDVNVGTPTQISSGSDANFNPGINRVKYEWASYYTNIRSCNLFLENVDKNTTLGTALITRMKAEARYLRAHAYFRLTNFFGDVPLITKVQTPEEAKVTPKTPKAEVVTFILTELDAAAADLPKKEDFAAADKGRITKGAAKAMKARVLLYNARWAECSAVCEDLMNNQSVNGNYSLQASFPDIFSATNKYNSEIISDLGYQPKDRRWTDWADFGPFYTGPNATAATNNNLVPTQDLVESFLTLDGKNIFEAGSGYDVDNAPYANRDPRLGYTVVYDKYVWVNNLGNSQIIYIKPGTAPDASNKKNEAGPTATTSGYYWRKYFDPTADNGTFNYGENIIIQRWAEVLLMEAEAKAMQGQMDATVWDNTIKKLRERAGFTKSVALNYPGNTTMTMIDQVRNERRSELAFESLRYDDIKRWKIAETVLNHPPGNEVRGAKFAAGNTAFLKLVVRTFNPAKHYLWPIPTESLQTDPNLTQNPGW